MTDQDLTVQEKMDENERFKFIVITAFLWLTELIHAQVCAIITQLQSLV